MNGVRVLFDEDAAMSAVTGELLKQRVQIARAVVAEARRLCPRGRTGKLRRGIKVIQKGDEVVVFVPPPGSFIEFGHDIIQGGKKVGHAPAKPFLRPAIMRVAGNSGQAYGEAVGEYAGAAIGTAVGAAVGYQRGGVIVSKILAAYGRRKGGQMGREVWTRAGSKVADMAEAKSYRDKALSAAQAVGELASQVSARRGIE